MDCSSVPSVPYSEGETALCPPELSSFRDHFQEKGWVVVPELLTEDEWQLFTNEFERHHRQRRPTSYEGPKAYVGGKANVELDAVQAMWEDSEVLRSLAFHPKVARAAAGLLGVPGVRVLQDQANTKPPGGGPTHVHQDHPYLPISEPLTVAAWVPLCEGGSREENGRMGYVSGSHRCGLKYLPFLNPGTKGFPSGMQEWAQGRSILEHPLLQTLEQGPAPTFVSVPPRAVAFHHGLCLHTSVPNNTDLWRHAFTTTYVADGCHVGSVMGIENKENAVHYVQRAGLKHGDLIAGPGADEHMPVAFPRDLKTLGLPQPPKGFDEATAAKMRKRGAQGFLPKL